MRDCNIREEQRSGSPVCVMAVYEQDQAEGCDHRQYRTGGKNNPRGRLGQFRVDREGECFDAMRTARDCQGVSCQVTVHV